MPCLIRILSHKLIRISYDVQVTIQCLIRILSWALGVPLASI